jgi:type IV pilus assembly protein PilW
VSARLARRQAGMSLVELMVGMAVGLIGIIIITHLYLKNEEYKRSTSGVGTAQVNGAIALYSMERDVRMAGFGFNNPAALGCNCAGANCSPVQYYYNGTYSSPPGTSTGALPPLTFAPVVITDNTGSPDEITILFGSDPERMFPGSLSESMPQPSSEFKVDGTVGFAVGDLVIVSQGATCMMTQVTAVQTASSHLQHNPGVSAPWNPSGGTSLMPGFAAGATLFNMGNPTWRTYSIGSNRLQVLDRLGAGVTGTAATALVDDIVDMQAEYGKDTNGDGTVDAWNTTAPTNADQWLQILAVRIGMLARSGNYERPGVPGAACEATTATPTWQGSGNAPSVFTVPGGLPSCYRYRVFDTVIPLRNIIWRP